MTWPPVGMRDPDTGRDLGQQAHRHELGGADREAAHGEGEHGEREVLGADLGRVVDGGIGGGGHGWHLSSKDAPHRPIPRHGPCPRRVPHLTPHAPAHPTCPRGRSARRHAGCRRASERRERLVERGRRTHDLLGQRVVGLVVAADVGRVPWTASSSSTIFSSLSRERVGDGREGGREVGVVGLRGEGLGPVEARGRSGSRGCRWCRACGRASGRSRGTCRWRGRACRRGPWPSALLERVARGARSWRRGRRTRRGSPSAGSFPRGTARRASARSRRRRFRTGRRRS